MQFIPRFSAPSANNKFYLHTPTGYNKCILIANNSCLPNCVGYAYGRTLEMLNITSANLPTCNAESWFPKFSNVGQIPKIGAIACWSKGVVGVGSDGAGHIAIVEQIEKDGTIITSNSGYNSTRFYLKTLKPPYNVSGYNFQGFIYLDGSFDNESEYDTLNYNNTEDKLSIEEIAKLVISGKFGNGSTRKTNLENLGYNYTEVQTKVNELLNVKTTSTSTNTTVSNSNLKHNIGDTVYFDYLYTDSYASKKLKSLIHSGKITQIYKGRKAPYLINNDSGFLSDDLIL